MNLHHPQEKPPVVMRRTFRVVAEVEVTIVEMPRTQAETELFGRVPYSGEGSQEFIDAENAVMDAILKSPEDLQNWLRYRAACATDLEHYVFDEHGSDDVFLIPVIERLDEQQQDLLSRSENESLFNAVKARIKGVNVEEKSPDMRTSIPV